MEKIIVKIAVFIFLMNNPVSLLFGGIEEKNITPAEQTEQTPIQENPETLVPESQQPKKQGIMSRGFDILQTLITAGTGIPTPGASRFLANATQPLVDRNLRTRQAGIDQDVATPISRARKEELNIAGQNDILKAGTASRVAPEKDSIVSGQMKLLIGDKTIDLSDKEWEKMEDPNTFAKNYLHKRKSPFHSRERIVTVFLIPMSADRKTGLKISEDEYLEIFIVYPSHITIQVMVDKEQYWVLSRETFDPKYSLSQINIEQYKPYLNESEEKYLWQMYQEEIDETRFLLREKF